MEKTRRIIVAGSRTFNNYQILSSVLDELLKEDGENIEIVCGEAKGADSLGRWYALEHNINIRSFPADWKNYGRSAGMIRNQKMANYATEILVFWDGRSVGTKNMIKLAKEKELPCTIVRF